MLFFLVFWPEIFEVLIVNFATFSVVIFAIFQLS